MTGDRTILEVRNLQTHFRTDEGLVRAVDGVSFTLDDGETLGLVGESGCGKSVTSLSILRLLPTPPAVYAGGEILYRGRDLLRCSEAELQEIRGGRIGMIFQDPMTSLNPFMRVSHQIMEALILHQGMSRKQAREKAIDLLAQVGIPDPKLRADQYPHQFSGGMRQRVMIAMALSCRPDILIADEPTTALDVTIQAQILELIRGLTHELGTSVILITHDLGVVAGICDNVAVMYAGRIVEYGRTEEIFARPRHPYTQGLLRSVPRLDLDPADEDLYSIPGSPPSPAHLPLGCRFHPRCPYAQAICAERYPEERSREGHRWACWLSDREGDGG